MALTTAGRAPPGSSLEESLKTEAFVPVAPGTYWGRPSSALRRRTLPERDEGLALVTMAPACQWYRAAQCPSRRVRLDTHGCDRSERHPSSHPGGCNGCNGRPRDGRLSRMLLR